MTQMRHYQVALVLCLFGFAPAAAGELQINQNAAANFTFIAVNKPDTSSLQITQSGQTNVISAAQLSPDLNKLESTQSGWSNTITVYQDGFDVISRVTQFGPDGSSHATNLPTSYTVTETDQGFLSTFTSGELSISTLTSSDLNYVSHFGRRH